MRVTLNMAKVRRRLVEEGITDTELANRAGLSKQRVSEVFKNERASLVTAGRIAQALEVDVESILGKESIQ